MEFSGLVQKFWWSIDINFYASFGSTILLKGYVSKYDVELFISEVKKVDFLF